MGNCASGYDDGEGETVNRNQQQQNNGAKAGTGVAPIDVAADATDFTKVRAMHKRIAVAAEAITNAADIPIPHVPKSEGTQRLIEQAIKGNLLFEMLSLPAKQAIISSMTAVSYTAGEEIIHQGDTEASKFYVLERGTCDAYLYRESWGQERQVHTYQPGSGFGELALLYSAPRAASVRATTDCRLWVMERQVYNAIKRTYMEQLAKEKRVLLERVPLLAMLASEHKQTVAEAMEMVEYKAGEVIFRQGEMGEKFYVVKEGTVCLSRNGKEISRLADGHFFGERALIREEDRQAVAATATADTYLVCYTLGRKSFNELLGPIESAWRYVALRKVPILFNLSEQQLFQLAGCMHSIDFAEGDVVFRQGDPGDSFYVVEDGTFSITNEEGAEVAKCGKGQCFGELALLRQEARAATVTATFAAKCMACTRDDFNHHLGSLEDIHNMWRFEALRKVPLLAPLKTQQRLALCRSFRSRSFHSGEAVISKGEQGDSFYIVEKGACVAVGDDSTELARFGPTAYFGERALLRREPRAATILAASETVKLLELGRAEFDALLGPLQALLERQAAEYDAVNAKITKPITLSDLRQLAMLGTGAFGKVSLVEYEGKTYALKTLSKGHIIQTGLQEHIKREKAVMLECSSPFLVNLLASFKDATHLYMLMELVQGGEFFTYLQTRDLPLSEDEARFYAACVILGLEYMHDRNIAWRDLKPENLLIETNGYLKITDFGFAKRIPAGGKSYTLCGTPEYLAPELVTQSGHSKAVDWWAVGVLIFEMVAGHPPFFQEDRVTMFRAICNTQYTLPAHFSKELKDLIRRLLVRVPSRRLGCAQGGATELKQHPWFKGFDWEALAQRKLQAPYIPKVSGPADASNFDVPQTARDKPQTARYQSTGLFADF
ncbi:hypothetical protein N2152v2_007051 [Parachlorella kessleri]